MGLFSGFTNSPKSEIWQQVANDIGGEYIKGNFWGKEMLVYHHNEWEFLLDTYTTTDEDFMDEDSISTTTTHTRMRAPFVNKDELDFEIFHEGFFSFIGKFFGVQDIQVGDDFFDRKFMIKGSDETVIKKLLSGERLKELFIKQPCVRLKIDHNKGWFSKGYPDEVSVLVFECSGEVKEKAVLLNLFELFAEILDRLTEIDSSYGENPYFRLR